MTSDAMWYKDAIIYQLHVRSFHDSNGDGIGDFRGLTQKLDYVHELGATAIWLLPFYPSPLKDDGYDISDYHRVNPSYGTLEDFQEFLEQAHRRGLKVVTELVLNHTSDEHPWFQRARRAPAGSEERDFYVWSDDPHRYSEARIIFKDFETSNWEWDPVAEAYYWHRFYSHQPDLNFDNPAVKEAVFGVLDFWLEMGVDGLRLDAVPYLYEREGTTCENLPETHAALRELRARVDARFDDRMLLAEANQWPEDAAAYFGDGDECHTNFHFPLMPRLFMALEREDRFPIVDILEQTPTIPENCQWVTFLRNHDELTLEMVTDEERDYMYRTFAADPRARINLGIRRRLAPLLGNDRRKIELMNVLLLTLTGTPVVYYGDEIGMGDNIYLGDRDGVRTPMQWSIDRNAGFSMANPQQLFLPIVVDPLFHYTTVNVEAQEANPSSLLAWMRRLIGLVRKRFQVFGRGSLEFVFPENPRVLTFVRQHEDEIVLMVANLSRYSQFVELDLSRFQGLVPVELFGRTRFPPVGDLPYLLSLGPHAYYLFSIERQLESEPPRADLSRLPELEVQDGWSTVLQPPGRQQLERALPEYLARQPWVEDAPRTVRIEGTIPLDRGQDQPALELVLVHVDYADAESETFCLPLGCAEGRWMHQLLLEHPGVAIASLRPAGGGESPEDRRLLYDAAFETPTATALLNTMLEGGRLAGSGTEVVCGYRSNLFEDARAALEHPVARWVREEMMLTNARSHEPFVLNDRFVFKVFRRLEPGVRLELEFGRFLQERGHVNLVPHVYGTLDVTRPQAGNSTLALLRVALQSEGNAFSEAEHELLRFLERTASEAGADGVPELLPTERFWLGQGDDACPSEVWECLGGFLQDLERLGERLAEFHLALASDTEDSAFAPEPFTRFYSRGLYQTIRSTTRRTFDLLRRRRDGLPPVVREVADQVLERESWLLDWYREATPPTLSGLRIRCHGDLRLQRLVYVGNDFRIVDFQGEPGRSYGERRIKRSPLQDVAYLTTSLQRVSQRSLADQELSGAGASGVGESQYAEWGDFWYRWTAATLLRSYFRTAESGAFLPQGSEERRNLLRLFALEASIGDLRRALAGAVTDAEEALHAIVWHSETVAGTEGCVPL